MTDLLSLAKTCKLDTLDDDPVLLVPVIGIRDSTVSDILQFDTILTLERTIIIRDSRKSFFVKNQTKIKTSAINKLQRQKNMN